MIVICINDKWYYTIDNTKWEGWAPIKGNLYEVINKIFLENEVYYVLRECPYPTLCFVRHCFREIDIDIKDIECEIVEEKELLNV